MSASLDADAWTIPKIDAAARARGAGLISFAGGAAHQDDLPLAGLSRALDEALSPQTLAYGSARGEESLLDALRDHFAAEDVDASRERTMVTAGAMAGIDLVFRRALDPGDVVVVESPTYSDSLISLALNRAKLVELPLDAEGADGEQLAAIAAEHGPPRAIYVIPTFHNPTGLTMSLARRRRLVELAAQLGSLLIEDDAYSAFRFEGKALPSLASLSPDVVSVRSLSKIVAPGLRLGCVIGPPAFLASLEQARGGVDICASPLAQAAAARFIAGGEVGPHVRRLTEAFRCRRDAMLDALAEHFGELGAEWSRPAGGMFVWMRLPGELDTVDLLDAALDEGVSFVPGSVFAADGGHRDALRLCFSSVKEEEIGAGVERLRAALDRLTGAAG
ncbi:MAG TPA: PLP-dependent aminotransferase family protein [Solirubrobacterales bacterium]|nr:PLP-dependent aminotransferase family protein [Solirubrobacterales bacterium]